MKVTFLLAVLTCGDSSGSACHWKRLGYYPTHEQCESVGKMRSRVRFKCVMMEN